MTKTAIGSPFDDNEDGTANQIQQMQAIDFLREAAIDMLGDRDATCSTCGEAEPLVLHAHDGDVTCYRCSQVAAGKSGTEAHHLVGRHNDPDHTVEIDANLHRLLSAYQSRWDTETLINAEQSPLRFCAAVITTVLDLLAVALRYALWWVPRLLEWLDERCIEHFGPRWWTQALTAPAP